jgi:hypothetical protein
MSKMAVNLNKRVRFCLFGNTLALLSLLLLAPIVSNAQSESGSAAVEGTVTDANGASVASATVTGFFPNVRAQEPTSAPSTARFGGARQLQLGVRFVF